MKAICILACMILFIHSDLVSQTPGGPITLNKKKYYMNGQVLKTKELKSILGANPASLPAFKKYKSNINVGAPLMVAGSACILVGATINLASAIKEANDINNGQMGNSYPSGLGIILVGAACELASLPFLFPARKHLLKSIEDYNTSLNATGKIPYQLEMVLHPASIGVRVSF